MKTYVLYNIALYKFNEEKKEFEMLGNQVRAEKELTQEQVDEMAQTVEGNVLVTKIGTFNELPEEEIVSMTADYYTQEQIFKIRKENEIDAKRKNT